LGPDGKPIPGPAEVRQIQAARKMAQQQAQVDEVIGIMHKNVENVLERDRKLGDLEERADALQDGCAQFEKQAAAMKNKFWMENLKAIIAGSVVGLLVLGLIYWKFFMPQPPPPGYGPPPGGAPAGGDQGYAQPPHKLPLRKLLQRRATPAETPMQEPKPEFVCKMMLLQQHKQAILKIDSILCGREDQEDFHHWKSPLPDFFCDTRC